ncbi:MAG: hypothetical protein U0640_08100 [Phycisphaerales bacterium]
MPQAAACFEATACTNNHKPNQPFNINNTIIDRVKFPGENRKKYLGDAK